MAAISRVWTHRPPSSIYDTVDESNILAKQLKYLFLPVNTGRSSIPIDKTVIEVYNKKLGDPVGSLDNSNFLLDPAIVMSHGSPAFSRTIYASQRAVWWDTKFSNFQYPFTLFAEFVPNKGGENYSGTAISVVNPGSESVMWGLGHNYVVNGDTRALMWARNTSYQSISGLENVTDKLVRAVAVFKSPSERLLYVDGKLIGSQNTSVNMPSGSTTARVSIGQLRDNSPGDPFRGQLMQAGVSSRAWTQKDAIRYAENPWQILKPKLINIGLKQSGPSIYDGEVNTNSISTLNTSGVVLAEGSLNVGGISNLTAIGDITSSSIEGSIIMSGRGGLSTIGVIESFGNVSCIGNGNIQIIPKTYLYSKINTVGQGNIISNGSVKITSAAIINGKGNLKVIPNLYIDNVQIKLGGKGMINFANVDYYFSGSTNLFGSGSIFVDGNKLIKNRKVFVIT